MTGPGAAILAILMLAAFLLAGGGAYALYRRRDVKKGVLMLLCALVLFGNVLIWTLP